MGEMQVINLDKVSFQLKERHNFEWLTNMGKVFSVFDEQDSGNICFGIEKDGVKKICEVCWCKNKRIYRTTRNGDRNMKEFNSPI